MPGLMAKQPGDRGWAAPHPLSLAEEEAAALGAWPPDPRMGVPRPPGGKGEMMSALPLPLARRKEAE